MNKIIYIIKQISLIVFTFIFAPALLMAKGMKYYDYDDYYCERCRTRVVYGTIGCPNCHLALDWK